MDLEQQTRRALFSKFVSEDELGLEIGPSYRPTFPKKEGWRVKVIDHCNRKDLIGKYQKLKVPKSFLNAIEEVDYVWQGERYSDLISVNKEKPKYVVACHVIEHVQDLVGFLQEMSEVIESNGYLLLAIPDKKSTFDFYRPISTLGDVFVASISPEIYDIKAKIDEDYLRSEFDGTIAWNQDVSRAKISIQEFPTPSIEFDDIRQEILKMKKIEFKYDGEYRDAHRWVFTLDSFTDLIAALSALEMTDFEIVETKETNYYEFLVVLKKVETRKRHNLRSKGFLLDLLPIIPSRNEKVIEICRLQQFVRKWTPMLAKQSIRRLAVFLKNL